jgi:hypothetical protein
MDDRRPGTPRASESISNLGAAPLSPAPSETAGMRDVQGFVLELGRALSVAGTAVSERERLSRVAASGVPDALVVVVLPTQLMAAFGRAGRVTIESIPQFAGSLRLDQISALYELVGLPSETALDDQQVNLLDWWAPWLGVMVFGVAAALYFSALPGALPGWRSCSSRRGSAGCSSAARSAASSARW